ncbi:MAG TPA: type IV secretion system DNA-binding domain-containing protein [Steroidobacteraceae bacterium]|nr:type IV secretion system DNA-binding domain-containing protein [Steroidobacteraceae bacterium]
MTPAQSFLHVLAMLWGGAGLADAFAWLPAGARMTLVVWLPRLFRLALLALGVAFAYRLLLASPGRRGSQHVRGTRLVPFRFGWLRRRLVFDRWKLRIGGVVFPKRLQPQHLLITGATGAGKSQTLHGMLDAIRGRGDRVIVTDIGAEALRGFGVGGDMLLNPLDARGASWSPFAELDSAADAERLAKSMIPDHQEGIEREWFIYSQALVAAVLKRLIERGEATNGALLHALTLAPPSELEALVSGLPAQALFHPGAEKMLASVRGIVGTYLAPYAYLPTDAGAKSWSIRRHVRAGKGWLWLSYREDQAAALRPLLAAWIGEAVSAILSLAPDAKRRHWLLLDEVASLGRVQGLGDALTKGRKYGLCAMVGLQSVAQLREAYGRDGAQTLLSCLSSQLLLRANDPETAEYASLHLGEREVVREIVSRSHERNRHTITPQHSLERLVLPSQIQSLPNRVGYLRLAGQDVVRRVKIPLVKRATTVEPFVPRKPTAAAQPAPPAVPTPVPPRRPPLDADAILKAARAATPELPQRPGRIDHE